MKVNEIINEDVSAEEQLGTQSLSSNLIPVLDFLKNRSEDKELVAKLRTDSLIQMVQNAGDNTFDYAALERAYDTDEGVKSRIAKFNPDEITIKSSFDKGSGASDSGEGGEDEHGGEGHQEDPTQIVDRMAKKASAKRK